MFHSFPLANDLKSFCVHSDTLTHHPHCCTLFIQFLGTGDPLAARHHRLAQTPAGATALPRDKPIAAHTCSHVCTCAQRERPLDHTHACAYMRPAGTLGTHPAVHAGKGVQAYWSLAWGDRMARVTAEPYSPFPPNLCSQPLLPPRTPAPPGLCSRC